MDGSRSIEVIRSVLFEEIDTEKDFFQDGSSIYNRSEDQLENNNISLITDVSSCIE